MNPIFLGLVVTAFAVSAWRQLSQHADAGVAAPMQALGAATITAAGDAVTLAIGLIGVMALFLGLMKVAEAGGLLRFVAALVRPMMQRLFPDVPPQHPAMGAMILNISANALGLGNAATPFGIRAMQQLQTLNPLRETATNAMVLFLAINTASVTLLPTSVIALRATAGSADPAGILPTTLFATICSTLTAIAAARLGQRLWPLPPKAAPPIAELGASPAASANATEAADPLVLPRWLFWLSLGLLIGFLPLTIAFGREISHWIIPTLVAGFLIFGAWRRIPIYEAFVDGAREGFDVAVRIIPYLVAILVAIGMLRASGALDMLVAPLGAWLAPLGLPAEGLIMALVRMLSGSGSFAYLASVMNDPAIGPDSYTGYLVGTIQASTETTFYVLAVYFGAVGVVRFRHAVFAGLVADVAGVIASVAICSLLHGE